MPALYRLGLGLRWGFIGEVNGFTFKEFDIVLQRYGANQFNDPSDVSGNFEVVESRGAFHIWKSRNFNMKYVGS